jgi:hypothetical protein
VNHDFSLREKTEYLRRGLKILCPTSDEATNIGLIIDWIGLIITNFIISYRS